MEVDLEALFDKCWDYHLSQEAMAHNVEGGLLDQKAKDDAWKWAQAVLGSDEDPRTLEIVEAEQKFRIPIKQPWAKYEYDTKGYKEEGYFCVSGIVDLVTRIDEKTLHFIDWKSGMRKDWTSSPPKVKEYEDLAADPQLQIYFWALRQAYPQIEHYMITIWYLKDGGPFTFVFGDKEYQEIEAKLQDKFMAIRNTTVPPRHKSWKCTRFCHYGTSNTEFPPTEFRHKELDPVGTPMCVCSEYNAKIEARGINAVVSEHFAKLDKEKKEKEAAKNDSSEQ